MQRLEIISVRDPETKQRGSVQLNQLPMPEPLPYEVRVKVIYASFCGSNAHR